MRLLNNRVFTFLFFLSPLKSEIWRSKMSSDLTEGDFQRMTSLTPIDLATLANFSELSEMATVDRSVLFALTLSQFLSVT